MTNDKLKGRDLDRVVAIMIMGWKLEIRTRKDVRSGETIHHWQIEDPNGLWWDLEQTQVESATNPHSWWCDRVGLPHYSADLVAARDILERLKGQGWTSPELNFNALREFHLSNGVSTLQVEIRNQKDAATAICKAALKTLEVGKPK